MTGFPNLLPAFPHTAEFIVNGKITRHDVDFQPNCGYVSNEEAELLWRLAKVFRGDWCEVGSHTGFSGAHIAAAGARLLALDPQYGDPVFLERTLANWMRADVAHRIVPVATISAVYLPKLLDDGARFEGAFIDGDHEPGYPLRDAQMMLPLMTPRCVIALHDGSGPPVHEAAEWLVEQGFRRVVYETMGTLNVCWRGDEEPTW